MKIISQLPDKELIFDFYGIGQKLVRESPDYEKAKKIVQLHGSVSSEKAIKRRAQADFLVNIDNTNLTQVPSKIFEYFSTGKPIINFYFDDQSPTLAYMKKYPNCININVNREADAETVSRLHAFISFQRDVIVPFETVEKLYPENTPEYVARQCIEAYEKAVTGTRNF